MVHLKKTKFGIILPTVANLWIKLWLCVWIILCRFFWPIYYRLIWLRLFEQKILLTGERYFFKREFDTFIAFLITNAHETFKKTCTAQRFWLINNSFLTFYTKSPTKLSKIFTFFNLMWCKHKLPSHS